MTWQSPILTKCCGLIRRRPGKPIEAGAGAWRREKGNLDHALADLNEAVRLNPRDATAYRERAHVWESKGG